jgi:hypothetical protein
MKTELIEHHHIILILHFVRIVEIQTLINLPLNERKVDLPKKGCIRIY